MAKIVTLHIDAALVDPLLESLESRAHAWQDTARILRTQSKADPAKTNINPAVAQRTADLYAALILQIKNQLGTP